LTYFGILVDGQVNITFPNGTIARELVQVASNSLVDVVGQGIRQLDIGAGNHQWNLRRTFGRRLQGGDVRSWVVVGGIDEPRGEGGGRQKGQERETHDCCCITVEDEDEARLAWDIAALIGLVLCRFCNDNGNRGIYQGEAIKMSQT